jgi:hypothetical protein
MQSMEESESHAVHSYFTSALASSTIQFETTAILSANVRLLQMIQHKCVARDGAILKTLFLIERPAVMRGCGCGMWAFCVPSLTAFALICAAHNLCQVAHVIIQSVWGSVKVCESHAVQSFLTSPLASLTIQLEATIFSTILVCALECLLLKALQR